MEVLAACSSNTASVPRDSALFQPALGTYVPLSPLALSSDVNFNTFPMQRSFSALVSMSGTLNINWAGLEASQKSGDVMRTIDCIAYTTVPLEGADDGSQRIFAVIGYGARGQFAMTYQNGKLSYSGSQAEGESSFDRAEVMQMGRANGPLTVALFPDAATTADAFKNAVGALLRALQAMSGTEVTVRPVLLGALVYSDTAIDRDYVGRRVLDSLIVNQMLFRVDKAEIEQAIATSGASARDSQIQKQKELLADDHTAGIALARTIADVQQEGVAGELRRGWLAVSTALAVNTEVPGRRLANKNAALRLVDTYEFKSPRLGALEMQRQRLLKAIDDLSDLGWEGPAGYYNVDATTFEGALEEMRRTIQREAAANQTKLD